MKFYSLSEKGKRESNQDYVLIKTLTPGSSLFLLADGMGGYELGDLAAKVINEAIVNSLQKNLSGNYEDAIKEAISTANEEVFNISKEHNKKLGATIAGIFLTKSKGFCFWIGDVQIYHFHQNKLIQQSRSHSLVNEMIQNKSVVNEAVLDKYRHIVTRSIQGDSSSPEADFFIVENRTKDDSFILCTDGVHNLFSGAQFQYLLNNKSEGGLLVEVKERCEKEASDNYSLILIGGE